MKKLSRSTSKKNSQNMSMAQNMMMKMTMKMEKIKDMIAHNIKVQSKARKRETKVLKLAKEATMRRTRDLLIKEATKDAEKIRFY